MLVAKVAEFACRKTAHVDAVDADGACIGLVKRSDDLQERGLSGPRWAYDADYFAFVDVQINAFEHLKTAETLCYILDVNHINDVF